MIKQTAGRDQLGDFAPHFAALNDDVLFGQVWNDSTLSPKLRSIITITAFMGRGLVDSSLSYHLETAKKNGVTRNEIVALVTHAAFYIGWPMGWAVLRLAKEIWQQDDEPKMEGELSKEAYQEHILFPIGEPNDAYADYFSGKSYLATISEELQMVHNVTFEPGCRNNWHIHKADSGGGQLLICIGGRGYYQEWGQKVRELHPGDVVNIGANVKHWHGAVSDAWFSHLALSIPGSHTSTQWLEEVTEEDYNKLP